MTSQALGTNQSHRSMDGNNPASNWTPQAPEDSTHHQLVQNTNLPNQKTTEYNADNTDTAAIHSMSSSGPIPPSVPVIWIHLVQGLSNPPLPWDSISPQSQPPTASTAKGWGSAWHKQPIPSSFLTHGTCPASTARPRHALDLKSLDVQWASNRASLRLATIFVLVIELILNAIDGIMASYHENIPIFQRGLSIL